MVKKLVKTGVTLGVGFVSGMYYIVAKTIDLDDYRFESVMNTYKEAHEKAKKYKKK